MLTHINELGLLYHNFQMHPKLTEPLTENPNKDRDSLRAFQLKTP
jgi:hypothetical protein